MRLDGSWHEQFYRKNRAVSTQILFVAAVTLNTGYQSLLLINYMVNFQDNNALLIYRVGPVYCCSPTTSVVAIHMPAPLTHPPGTDDGHPGMFKHSSGIVRVSDLRFQFGVKKSDWQHPGRQIITNLDGEHIGFWVDEIIDVIRFPGAGWNDLPAKLPRGVFSRTLLCNDHIHLFADFNKLNTLQGGAYLREYITSLEQKNMRESKQTGTGKSTVATRLSSTRKAAAASTVKPAAAVENKRKSASASLDKRKAGGSKDAIGDKHVKGKVVVKNNQQDGQRHEPRQTQSAAKASVERQHAPVRAAITEHAQRNNSAQQQASKATAGKTPETNNHTSMQDDESSAGMVAVILLLVFVLAGGAGGYYLLMDSSSESPKYTYLETMPAYNEEIYSLEDGDSGAVYQSEDMALAFTGQDEVTEPVEEAVADQTMQADTMQHSVAVVETEADAMPVVVANTISEPVVDATDQDGTTVVPVVTQESSVQDDSISNETIDSDQSEGEVDESVMATAVVVDDVPVEQGPETVIEEQDADVMAMADQAAPMTEQVQATMDAGSDTAAVTEQQQDDPVAAMALSQDNARSEVALVQDVDEAVTQHEGAEVASKEESMDAVQTTDSTDTTQQVAAVKDIQVQEQVGDVETAVIEKSENVIDVAESAAASDSAIEQAEQTVGITDVVQAVAAETDSVVQKAGSAVDSRVSGEAEKEVDEAVAAQPVDKEMAQIAVSAETEATHKPEDVVDTVAWPVKSVQQAVVLESAPVAFVAEESAVQKQVVVSEAAEPEEADGKADEDAATQRVDQATVQPNVETASQVEPATLSGYRADIIEDEQGVTIVLNAPADEKVLVDDAIVTTVVDAALQQVVSSAQVLPGDVAAEPVPENVTSDQDVAVDVQATQPVDVVAETEIENDAQVTEPDELPAMTAEHAGKPAQTEESEQLAVVGDTPSGNNRAVTTPRDTAVNDIEEKAADSQALVGDQEAASSDETSATQSENVSTQPSADVVALREQSAQTTDNAAVEVTVAVEMDTGPAETVAEPQVDQAVTGEVSEADEVKAEASSMPLTPAYEVITHIVVKGDTLWHIAERYVNNPFLFPELARLSNIKNPDLIYPGDRVRIIHYSSRLSTAGQ